MSQINCESKKRCDLIQRISEMRDVNIRTIDPATVKDIDDVNIDTTLPVPDRVASFVRQIGNPYCYRSHGVIVKISFAGTESLEECLANCISLE